jgi:DNA mismatch repair ATPase MutS
MITGANQGGKSTFLRGLGQAQLMAQAGMFVGAESYCAAVVRDVFTHYKREEDPSLRGGKLAEELSRMSAIADTIRPRSLLLCNESFATTNGREGSQIAAEVVRAMLDCGVRVVFVTHLFDLAEIFRLDERGSALFLRAERGENGTRPFKLMEGPALPTSYGEDAYRKVFGRGGREQLIPTDISS